MIALIPNIPVFNDLKYGCKMWRNPGPVPFCPLKDSRSNSKAPFRLNQTEACIVDPTTFVLLGSCPRVAMAAASITFSPPNINRIDSECSPVPAQSHASSSPCSCAPSAWPSAVKLRQGRVRPDAVAAAAVCGNKGRVIYSPSQRA